jgi:hypothetical protein
MMQAARAKRKELSELKEVKKQIRADDRKKIIEERKQQLERDLIR